MFVELLKVLGALVEFRVLGVLVEFVLGAFASSFGFKSFESSLVPIKYNWMTCFLSRGLLSITRDQ